MLCCHINCAICNRDEILRRAVTRASATCLDNQSIYAAAHWSPLEKRYNSYRVTKVKVHNMFPDFNFCLAGQLFDWAPYVTYGAPQCYINCQNRGEICIFRYFHGVKIYRIIIVKNQFRHWVSSKSQQHVIFIGTTLVCQV